MNRKHNREVNVKAKTPKKVSSQKFVGTIFLLVIFISVIAIQRISITAIESNSDYIDFRNPEASDIAGSELYAEQLSAVVAGNHSLIMQSVVTNDSNIFNYADLRDPAFEDVSFLISTSNGIRPSACPAPMGNESVRYNTSPFMGFFYFQNTTNNLTIERRLNRLVSILRENLYTDIIFTEPIENESFGYYYPFVSDYPKDWNRMANILLGNLPKDGIWGAYDEKWIFSPLYMATKYLGLSIMHIEDINSIEKIYALESSKYSSIKMFLDAVDIKRIMGSTDMLDTTISTFFRNNTAENPEGNPDENPEQDFSGTQGLGSFFGLATDSLITNSGSLTFINLQYEGSPNAIRKELNGNYTFSLFEAIGYRGETLKISEKIFISLIGALLSTISINIYSAEVFENTPDLFKIADYNLKKVEMALFLMGQTSTFNITQIRDYTFKTKWTQIGPLTQLTTFVQNLNNDLDPVNFLQFLGFGNFPAILQGLFDPLPNVVVKYRVSNESSLIITKTISNASNSVINSPVMNITVTNPNPFRVYGQEMNLSMLGISNRMLVSGPLSTLMVGMGIDPDEYFPDVNARFFLIDTYGTGIHDTLYPSITNPMQLLPYSPELANRIEENRFNLWLAGYTHEQIDALKNSVSSPDSIFNPNNWFLEPNDSFTVSITNLNVSAYDTYTDFGSAEMYIENGITPTISYGTQVDGTSPANTRIEGQSWNITSQDMVEMDYVQFYASFKNESILDIENNELDGLNFTINYTADSISTVKFEIWNLNNSQFETHTGTFDNESLFVELNTGNTDLLSYVDISDNYSVTVRISIEFTKPSRIDISHLNMSYLARDLNPILMSSSIVTFSTANGVNTFSSRSNSQIIGTSYMASLTAWQSIDSIPSYCGGNNSFHLTVKNLGDREAKNINITIAQPGILRNLQNHRYIGSDSTYRMIADAGDFVLDEGILSYSIPSLLPGESVENLTFDFITPNSEIISGARIEWDNYQKFKENSSDFMVQANDVFMSAPIDYLSTESRPYTHRVQFSYKLNLPEGQGVRINSTATVSVKISNCGDEKIDFIRVKLPAEIEGLELTGAENLYIANLSANTSAVVNFNVTKVNFRGYFLSPIENFGGLNRLAIRPVMSTGLLLGSINLTVERIMSSFDMLKGSSQVIRIRITNHGSIEAGNFTVNDNEGYNGKGFKLIEGSPIAIIENLNPGESYEFTHTIKAENQGHYNLTTTKIIYYYISRIVYQSEFQKITIRENPFILAAWVYVPVSIGLIALFGFKRYKENYGREEIALERKERRMFGDDFTTRAWDKQNFTGFLENLKNQTKEESK